MITTVPGADETPHSAAAPVAASPLRTPVVLLAFNRPDTTRRVLARIAAVRPETLFVVADGPRRDRADDGPRCRAVRDAVAAAVDWDCDLRRDYADENLGCRRRVGSGLDWVFGHVERAIVVEDDCVPALSFFRFCEELLERFADDQRVMSICGTNMAEYRSPAPGDYHFSRFNTIWGWATWRRAWSVCDMDMAQWPRVRDSGEFAWMLPYRRWRRRYRRLFEDSYLGRVDTWDLAWRFAHWLNNGLAAIPRHNLVSNIGFGAEALHTKDSRDPLAELRCTEIEFPLAHPPAFVPCVPAEIAAERRLDRGMLERAWRKARRLVLDSGRRDA